MTANQMEPYIVNKENFPGWSFLSLTFSMVYFQLITYVLSYVGSEVGDFRIVWSTNGTHLVGIV